MNKLEKLLSKLWYPLASASLIAAMFTSYDVRYMFYTLLFTMFAIREDLKEKK